MAINAVTLFSDDGFDVAIHAAQAASFTTHETLAILLETKQMFSSLHSNCMMDKAMSFLYWVRKSNPEHTNPNHPIGMCNCHQNKSGYMQ